MDPSAEPPFTTLIADGQERLDRFLARRLPAHSRSKLARLIDSGGVFVDGRAQRRSFRLEDGMVVIVPEVPESMPHALEPAYIQLDVRYEDADLLVVNKPRGLATHPAASLKQPSLVNALLSRPHGLSRAGGAFRPGIVHRLDKDTTGLIIVAKTDAAHVALARQIERKEADRRYVAIVAGIPAQSRFTIEGSLGRDPRNRQKISVQPGGKTAVTHVKVLRSVSAGALLALKLETGRTHQIRVHLSAIGHPVVGDPTYAPSRLRDAPMQLHAAYLRFAHPTSGESIEVFAEAPSDFLAEIARADVEEF